MNVTELKEWKALQALSTRNINIADELNNDHSRAIKYEIKQGNLLFNYAKSLLDDEALKALLALAKATDVENARDAMFAGKPINNSEDKAVLHTALRNAECNLNINAKSIAEAIESSLQKARDFTDKLRAGEIVGYDGSPIKNIVNIGIGGSDLGPKMVTRALQEFHHPGLNCHFVSNVDGASINQLLKTLNPQTTLIIIQSKTFTTIETLTNAHAGLDWFENHGVNRAEALKQCIAVTAKVSKAQAFGIATQNIFEFWDWVGGRYSLWSVIGLPIMITVGYDNFMQLLKGGYSMDKHFQTTPLANNMPVIAALIGVWYRNFLNCESYAILPYCQRLEYFPAYIQQLDMESNGKSVTKDNETVLWQTGPVIWGQPGTDGQHAFHQLLHQGSSLVPVDFIIANYDALSTPRQHKLLAENMLAQSAALMKGRQTDEAFRCYAGNRPSNIFIMKQLSPDCLGQLIAFYEHKVFVQGVIWQINSFDQWGVELGKELASTLSQKDYVQQLDSATKHLQSVFFDE